MVAMAAAKMATKATAAQKPEWNFMMVFFLLLLLLSW